MTMDTDMKIDYVMLLKHLEHQLATMDGRRAALQKTIAGLKELAATEDAQLDLSGFDAAPEALSRQNGKPLVKPGFFKGKTPTQAWRDFKALWGTDFRPPEIADAFEAGGMDMSRTKMIQAIHSVLKRERNREKKKAKRDDAVTRE